MWLRYLECEGWREGGRVGAVFRMVVGSRAENWRAGASCLGPIVNC